MAASTDSVGATGLTVVVAALVRRSVEKLDVPEQLAHEAARATLLALSGQEGHPRLSARADAYFTAVVRRKLLRSRTRSRAVSRLLAASVVEDLRESGRGPQEVWNELQRGWSDSIPADVLEEYRARLCA